MTKTKTLGLSLAVLFSAILVTGVTNAFAGVVVNPPDIDSASVLDDGSKLDVDVFAVSNIPTTPPGFIGYGTIIGSDGDGDPVLRVATSHGGVCDNEEQAPFGDGCEGVWHNHDATLQAPVELDDALDIQDCSDQGATFEVKGLSFESPGTVSVLSEHLDMSNVPKTSLTNTNVIPEPFIANFDFSQNPLVQKSSYPVAQFRIFVATTDGGAPLLDANGVPSALVDDRRHVCIFDVKLVDSVIGGKLLSTDTTALAIAGLQASAVWLLPTVVGIAGAGIYFVRSRINKE